MALQEVGYSQLKPLTQETNKSKLGALRMGLVSTPTYSFPQDPVLLSLSPQWGPQSGGTQLTIHGQYLQTGGNVSAFVGDQPCLM